MTCPEEQVLVQFSEGRLDDATRAQVDAHVDGCRTCRLVVAGLASSQQVTPSLGNDSTLASPFTARPRAGARLAVGASFGRYQVVGFLGAGAMGEVYLATDPTLGRRVALKVLRVEKGRDTPALRARLVREAQAMARLSHPNVVAVYEVGDEAGQVFVAMEFIDGESLRRWQGRPNAWRAVVAAYLEAGRGLEAAHSRGLVHRDFKPDNVLRGSDGRVRVTDFGLAADVDDALVASDPGAFAPKDLRLTQTGALVGTPAYMAPEMLAQRGSGPASDQFAFCLALVEALTGKRPMDGQTLAELEAARVRGPVFLEAPGVPAGVWKALRRGLAHEPRDRWPTMEPLLTELATALAPPRRWPYALAAGVALSAAAAGLVSWTLRAPSCEVPPAALAGVWDDGQRSRVTQALAAMSAPFARATSARVVQVLDSRAQRWREARREACEATWVTRTQSEHLLDLRMRCLDRAKDELGAVAALFASADDGVVTQASSVLAAMQPLSWCADARLLASTVTPPTPAQLQPVTAVREALARTLPLIAAKPGTAVEALVTLEARAKETGWAPLSAEVLAHLAEAHLAASDAKKAEDAARLAITGADAVGADVDRARALLTLIDAVGPEQARWSEGEAFARDARAVVQRLGNDTRLLALLELREGKLLYTQSRYADALPHYQRALELREQLFGRDDPQVAEVLQLLAICTGSLGRLDEAKGLYERALALREAALGPDHPDVAATLNTLGIDASDRGDYEAARAYFERALAVRIKALGPDHSRVGHVLNNLAGVHLSLGEAQAAQATIDRAIAVEGKSLGADHPSLAEPWQLKCEIEATLGNEQAAVQACETALRVTLAKRAPTHVRVGLVQLSWGEALLALGKPAEALEHLRDVRAPLSARVGPDDLYLVLLEAAEAEALVSVGRAKDALPNIDRALKAVETNTTLSPDLVGRVLAVASHVTWAADRPRADALTTRARQALEARPTSAKRRVLFEAAVAKRSLAPR
ncbi:MAG: tetratricopeptide repeat protein [Myxococcaceae bacterium]|nr:tetratricopeptide repeat protein [Myxococcaceae bacterium]